MWGASIISAWLIEDADVLDVGRVGAEEDEVAGLQRLPGGTGGPASYCCLRGARQLDARACVGGLDEAGAVEAAGPVAAPLVGSAELRERVG